MISHDTQPSSSRAVLNIRAHHASVPAGTGGNKCPIVIFAASTDHEHHVVCDVYDSNIRRHIDTHKVSDCIDLIIPCRDGTDTKKSLSILANFPFRFPADIYRHIGNITSVNDNIALSRLVGMDHADTSELIEALTQLSLRPQTRIVDDAEFYLESELNARRALA